MANVPDSCWRIRRRLRHLKSLEARNLRDEGSNESLEASACFYKLWQQTPDAKQDQQAMTWLYTSEQVYGGTSPQWGEIHLGDREDISYASMHGLHSDQLHLHIYAAPAPIELQQTADDSSLSRSSQPKADPQHNTEPASANNVKTAPSGMKASNGFQNSSAAGRNSVSEEQLHAANKSSFPNGTTDTKWRRPDIQLTADATQLATKVQQQDRRSHAEDCNLEPSSCKLILAADITLNALERLPDILDLDNRVLPSNTLVLELTDGLYIWPPSSHIRRTASGAVPAIIPEISPDAQESVSRSGKWSQLPAIAEEPQAAAQPALSSSGTAATRVAARDLEAGLRAALEAQRSLQARKRRRDKLLRALSKAVEVRGHAQQQKEQVERLRDRARERQSAAQRMQRSAAALRRSLALSSHVAILQAQALADACTAMLEAARRVQGAARLLEVEGRGSRLASLQRQLVSRRCRLAVGYGAVYSVGPKRVTEPEPPAGGFLWDLMDHLWFTAYVLGRQEEQHVPDEASDSLDVPFSPAPSEYGSHTSSLSRLREYSQLAIGGLELEPDLAKKILDTDAELAAAAVGYATRLTQRLAAMLDVPLRYPLRFANSRSSIYSHAPPAGNIREMFESEAKNGHRGVFELLHLSDKASSAGVASLAPREFPLYYGGKELKPFQYGLFLLSKDVEQLLNAHGLHSMGGAQLLQNLYKLLAAAASGAPNSSSSARAGSY